MRIEGARTSAPFVSHNFSRAPLEAENLTYGGARPTNSRPVRTVPAGRFRCGSDDVLAFRIAARVVGKLRPTITPAHRPRLLCKFRNRWMTPHRGAPMRIGP